MLCNRDVKGFSEFLMVLGIGTDGSFWDGMVWGRGWGGEG